jgi:hypothetical protein
MISQPAAPASTTDQRRPAGNGEITAILSRSRGGTEAIDDITATLGRLTLTAAQRDDVNRCLNAMSATIALARTALSSAAAVTA